MAGPTSASTPLAPTTQKPTTPTPTVTTGQAPVVNTPATTPSDKPYTPPPLPQLDQQATQSKSQVRNAFESYLKQRKDTEFANFLKGKQGRELTPDEMEQAIRIMEKNGGAANNELVRQAYSGLYDFRQGKTEQTEAYKKALNEPANKAAFQASVKQEDTRNRELEAAREGRLTNTVALPPAGPIIPKASEPLPVTDKIATTKKAEVPTEYREKLNKAVEDVAKTKDPAQWWEVLSAIADVAAAGFLGGAGVQHKTQAMQDIEAERARKQAEAESSIELQRIMAVQESDQAFQAEMQAEADRIQAENKMLDRQSAERLAYAELAERKRQNDMQQALGYAQLGAKSGGLKEF